MFDLQRVEEEGHTQNIYKILSKILRTRKKHTLKYELRCFSAVNKLIERERGRERQRPTDKQRQGQRDRQTDRDRDRERQRKMPWRRRKKVSERTETLHEGRTGWGWEGWWELRERGVRDRSGRGADRQTVRDRERQRQTETERDGERQRQSLSCQSNSNKTGRKDKTPCHYPSHLPPPTPPTSLFLGFLAAKSPGANQAEVTGNGAVSQH